MKLSRLQAPRSLREDIATRLRAAVTAGRLRPGTVYSVPNLAKQFGVSPTPVREAILDLAKEGLISIVKNRGFRVSALSEEELDEITEMRTFLEVPAVTAQAGKLSRSELSRLRRLADAIVTAAHKGDLAAYLRADTAFHAALLGTHGNRLLVETVTDLRNRTRLYGLDALADSGKLPASAAEHVELVDLLEAGRADDVERLVKTHLSHVRGIWAGRSNQ